MEQEFWSWMVAQAKLRKATRTYTMSRWRYMASEGLDWAAFCRSPADARAQGDAFLVRYAARTDSQFGARTYEKTLNLAVRFAQDRQPLLIWPYWRLTKEPKVEGKTLSDIEMDAALNYKHRRPLVEARRRAMAYLAFWTRLRRSEIARLRLRDFNQTTRRIWVEFPAKGGKKRWKAVPGNVWHPNGVVQAYLRLRPQPADGSDALWTHKHGQRVYAMTVDAVGMEFQRMKDELGFGVSFVRTRRAGARYLKRHKVRTRIIKADMSHSHEGITEVYLDGDGIEEQEAEFQRCKVPGFANRSRGQGGSRRPVGDFAARA